MGARETDLALDIVLVNVREIVLRELKRDGQQDVQGVEDLAVQRL